jgi:uncharacterized protein (TIGR02001 family)
MKKTWMFLISISLVLQPAYAIQSRLKGYRKFHKKQHYQIEPAPTPKTEIDVIPPVEPFQAFTGLAAFMTNYVFRGISQTKNEPSAQVSLTYALPIGLYTSLFGSNVNQPSPTGSTSTNEVDAVIGARNGIGDHFSYDINFAGYFYPGTPSANYNELNSTFIYRFFKFGVSYTGNAMGYHGTGIYYMIGFVFNIPAQYAFHVEGLSVDTSTGHYSLNRAAGNSYNDYSFMITKKINDTYNLSLQGTSTNGRQHWPPYDNSAVIAILAANF